MLTRHTSSPDRRRMPFDPATFLPKFCAHLQEDSRRLSIDYVTLTRTCHDLMFAMAHHERYAVLSRRLEPAGSGFEIASHLDKSFRDYDHRYYWRCAYIILLADQYANRTYENIVGTDGRRAGISALSETYHLGKWCEDYMLDHGILLKDTDAEDKYDSDLEERKIKRVQFEDRQGRTCVLKMIRAELVSDEEVREMSAETTDYGL